MVKTHILTGWWAAFLAPSTLTETGAVGAVEEYGTPEPCRFHHPKTRQFCEQVYLPDVLLIAEIITKDWAKSAAGYRAA